MIQGDEEKHPLYKSGFVAVVGRPNVGKSRLINSILGQKIAAVSSKPQMTRRQQLGILSLEDAQVIFVDTPGIHLPHHLLGEGMNREAESAIHDADQILWVVDGSSEPTEEDRRVAGQIQEIKKAPPSILAVNKIDLITQGDLDDRIREFHSLYEPTRTVPVSALTGKDLDRLLVEIVKLLPEGDLYFPDDQLTDAYERDIAADLIREAALEHLFGEVPHCIAIRIDEFTERSESGAFIAATIFVERESQKAIVIGQRGEMIKRIGTTARKEIESMSGRKVFLELKVKTRANWRNDKNALSAFGFRNVTS
jgi:GTP-binding protein Era